MTNQIMVKMAERKTFFRAQTTMFQNCFVGRFGLDLKLNCGLRFVGQIELLTIDIDSVNKTV